MTGSTPRAARDQADRSFEALIGPHLGELRVHCYRMLGSALDAEDLLQETITAAWQAMDGFEGRSSVRTWLYRIATNRCLNAIRNGRRRPPAEPVAPFALPPRSRDEDVTWLQPCPTAWLDAGATVDPARRYEARESIELAFVAALQRLPPRQTAVLVLCDLLGFAPAEAAAMLDVSPVAAKGLLQRARAGTATRRMAATDAPDHERDRAVARRFADAYAADDIDRLLALLTDDAWLAMPPAPHVYVGHGPIAAFLHASVRGRAGRRFVLTPTDANGSPAFVYGVTATDGSVRPGGVMVVTVAGDRVSVVRRFMDARLPALFGRASLAGGGGDAGPGA